LPFSRHYYAIFAPLSGLFADLIIFSRMPARCLFILQPGLSRYFSCRMMPAPLDASIIHLPVTSLDVFG
jgi:hypothetical protein